MKNAAQSPRRSLTGGLATRAGHYVNLRELALVTLAEPGALPGDADSRYVRLPLPLALAFVVAISGAFMVFLPLIGFTTPLIFLVFKVVAAVKRSRALIGASRPETAGELE